MTLAVPITKMTVMVLIRAFISLGIFLSATLYHFWNNTVTSRLPSSSNLEGLRAAVDNDERDDGKKSAKYGASRYTHHAEKDRIHGLPGLNYDPGFRQFAGYLTVDEDHGRHIFYWYVESQNDPENDPLVFWTNGGPGCSGLFGFGVEHGPFIVDGDGVLRPNPFSWNKVGSILYVEQPAGVGFSYSEAKRDYYTGDIQVASDNYRIIRQFLSRFPERRPNRFFIASESYGGHYMPQLAMEILTHDKDRQINFSGMLIGNPYVDLFTNTVSRIETIYAHGLLPKPLYDQWKPLCTVKKHLESTECTELEQEFYQKLGPGINPYGLDYPVCSESGHHRGSVKTTSSQVLHLLNHTAHVPPFLPREDEYRPCSEVHFTNYLRRGDVQEAIHASNTIKWKGCSSEIRYSMQDYKKSQIDLFREIIHMGRKGRHSLNILIVSGDDDSICSTTGTQDWIYDLGAPPKKHSLWKPWKVDGQTAGFVTHFDMGRKTKATLTFATVHGAGHEIPSFLPMEALQLFIYYLRGEW
jgi:carboxypeptidase C (cathepsin A)